MNYTLTLCPSNPTELGYLRWAARRAMESGLPREFYDEYRRYRAKGDDAFTAAWSALYDWDMLDVSQMIKQ